MSFNADAPAFQRDSVASKMSADTVSAAEPVARPPKLKDKPTGIPQSLSAMNIAMTPEEEAIAQRVDISVQAECSQSDRSAAAGSVAHSVKSRARPVHAFCAHADERLLHDKLCGTCNHAL